MEYRDLTEDERNTIDNALMVAAERFRDHVKQLDEPEFRKARTEADRLKEQFARQATEADKLREMLADSDIQLRKFVEVA